MPPRIKRRVVRDPVTKKRTLTRTWYCWVPDGRGGTKLVTTHCTDKKAAETRAAELEREAVDPAYAASNETTLQRVLDDYEASRKRMKRAQGTLDHVRVKAGHILRVVRDVFHMPLGRDLSQNGHQVLVRYIDRRQEEGARNTTIKKELRVFGAAWTLARRNKIVATPLDEIMPELEDDYTPKTRWLTWWEVLGLTVALRDDEALGRRGRAAIVAFAVATGCDASALWRARREDVAHGFASCHIHGTKRESRDRYAQLPLPEQRILLAWAVSQADGKDGKLFRPWVNMRRDLLDACAKLGIERCSPNDLRRSYAKWLRNAGIEPALVGPAMGHADGRMVERIYGKMTDGELANVMAMRLGGVPTARLLFGDTRYSAASAAIVVSESTEKKAENLVRRDGIEPPTRGFSIRDGSTEKPDGSVDSAQTYPPNVRLASVGNNLPPGLTAVRVEVDGTSARTEVLPGETPVSLVGRVSAAAAVLTGRRSKGGSS